MKREAMRVTAGDVAEAAGVGYRTCLSDEKKGIWRYGDLVSIIEYVKERRGGEERKVPDR